MGASHTPSRQTISSTGPGRRELGGPRLARRAEHPGRNASHAGHGEVLSDGAIMRSQLDERSARAEPKSLSAFLNDLVDSGLVCCSGRGRRAMYGFIPQKDLERLLHDDDELSLANMLWLQLATQGAQSADTLAHELGVDLDTGGGSLNIGGGGGSEGGTATGGQLEATGGTGVVGGAAGTSGSGTAGGSCAEGAPILSEECGAEEPEIETALVPPDQVVHCTDSATSCHEGQWVRLVHAQYGELRDCSAGCFSSHVCAIEDPDEASPMLFYAVCVRPAGGSARHRQRVPGSRSRGDVPRVCSFRAGPPTGRD